MRIQYYQVDVRCQHGGRSVSYTKIAMNSADADASSFPITKEIRQRYKKACQRQKLAQESKKGAV